MSSTYGCLYPTLMIGPDDQFIPVGAGCLPVIDYGPGGGGYGALMSNRHFRRYEVDGKWRGVKRVSATPTRSRTPSRSR